MHKLLTVAFAILITLNVNGQTVIPLYTGQVPNSIPTTEQEVKNIDANGRIRYGKVSQPTLEIFLPDKSIANGTAILIIPGGGYGIVAYKHEGTEIAAEFNKLGVAAFVLKYRLPSDLTMPDKTIGPLQDAQQALKTIRMHSQKWNIDTAKVGVIGFSAGGHLASTLGTHFNTSTIANKEQTSLRPDFMILVYPVVSFSADFTHQGSRDKLIGLTPTPEMVELYSNEKQVTAKTPSTLLIHAGDDKTVNVAHSLRFYEALHKNNVPAELHIYPKGGHGFGLHNKLSEDKWFDRVTNWLKSSNLTK